MFTIPNLVTNIDEASSFVDEYTVLKYMHRNCIYERVENINPKYIARHIYYGRRFVIAICEKPPKDQKKVKPLYLNRIAYLHLSEAEVSDFVAISIEDAKKTFPAGMSTTILQQETK